MKLSPLQGKGELNTVKFPRGAPLFPKAMNIQLEIPQAQVDRKLIIDVDKENFNCLLEASMGETSVSAEKGKGEDKSKGTSNFSRAKGAKKEIPRTFQTYAGRGDLGGILSTKEGDSEETEEWKRMLGWDVIELRETARVEMERLIPGIKEAYVSGRDGMYASNTVLTTFGYAGCGNLLM